LATRLYLHRTAKSLTGTLPSTEQSTLTQNQVMDALANNKDMNETISASAQTTLAVTAAMTSSNINVYIGRWVSDPLGVTSISANTWTINFAAKNTDGLSYFPGDGSNKFFANIYIWRPSTGAKVGTMVADLACTNNIGSSFDTSERTAVGSFTGSLVNCQTGDVIIVEIWTKPKHLTSGSNTMTFYYDGVTVTTGDDAAATNHAAFIETPQNNLFVPASITATSDYRDIKRDRALVKV
jgi:hypothetical protein